MCSPAPTRRRRGRMALLAAGVLAGVLVVASGGSAPPAGAQAEAVRVTVSTRPARPEPGDDVKVKVRVRGCGRDPVQAQVFLSSDDGATAAPVQMGGAAAVTSLVLRSTAVVELPDAVEGWYGVRVTCGAFRPPRRALPNTSFAVGALPTRTWSMAGTSVPAGGVLRAEGSGCRGVRVEYQVVPPALVERAFLPASSFDVTPDGSWAGDVAFPETLPPGPIGIRVRCIVRNSDGQEASLPYGELMTVTVVRDATATDG